MSAPVLGPSERAFVARVREAAAMASDVALSDREVMPLAQAWQEVVTAADALLAAEPEAGPRQPFFHRLGCPMAKGYQSSTAAHCTCAEPPARLREQPGDRQWCPACGNSVNTLSCGSPGHVYKPEPPAAPAPDAELEKLLNARLAHWRDMCHRWGPGSDLALATRDAIHDEVQRREAAARGEVVGTGYLCRDRFGHYSVDAVSRTLDEQAYATMPEDGIPVALTRRAE